jgi:hypothetical protein
MVCTPSETHRIHLPMSIVLPTLDKWVEGRLSAVLKATTQAAFDEAFDDFLAEHVHVTVNGAHIKREAYKKQLEAEGALNQEGATVKFDGAVVVPQKKDTPQDVIPCLASEAKSSDGFRRPVSSVCSWKRSFPRRFSYLEDMLNVS